MKNPIPIPFAFVSIFLFTASVFTASSKCAMIVRTDEMKYGQKDEERDAD